MSGTMTEEIIPSLGSRSSDDSDSGGAQDEKSLLEYFHLLY